MSDFYNSHPLGHETFASQILDIKPINVWLLVVRPLGIRPIEVTSVALMPNLRWLIKFLQLKYFDDKGYLKYKFTTAFQNQPLTQ